MTPLLSSQQIEELFKPGVDLDEMVEAITKTICEYCNTTFELTTRSNEKYDSRVEVMLVHRPIHSVLALSDDGKDLTEDADFFVYDDKLVVEYPSRKKKGLLVTYKSGFEEPPQTVKDVALELAKFRAFKYSEGNLLYYKSQRTEERSYEISDEEEIDILVRLNRWVQPPVSKRGRGSLRIGYMNG